MLELYNIIWVVPGVVFIHVYNKRRPAGSINLSGWSYIFSLVIMAVVLWLPVLNTLEDCSWHINLSKGRQNFIISVFSGFLACLLALLFTSWDWLAKFVFLPVYDIFFINCVNWENKSVIISLKNDKIYIGVLLKYPENPKSRYESQMISIYPLRSGGRNQKTKKVIWETRYPSDIKGNCEIIIPRSEIVTFGIFNEETFKHFYRESTLNYSDK